VKLRRVLLQKLFRIRAIFLRRTPEEKILGLFGARELFEEEIAVRLATEPTIVVENAVPQIKTSNALPGLL
jgi:hypothetical protein